MDIQFTCRHCELSEDLREYVTKKAERIVKYFDGVHSVEVIFSRERGKSKAEMIVGAVRGQRCVAEQVHEDLFAAVDIVVGKIDRQIRKLKGKLRGHRTGKVTETPPTETETPEGE